MMKLSGRIFNIMTSVILTAVIPLLYGCVKEMEDNLSDNEYIAFTAAMSDDPTKAAPTTVLTGDAGIIGYVYDQWPSGDEVRNFAPWGYLKNVNFSFDGYMLTADSDRLIKWSAAEGTDRSKLRIFAYTPVSDDNMTVSYGTDGNYRIPAITYTVPTDIRQQKDIVTATAEVSTSFRKNIPLTFDHILTGLKFKAGFDCTVKSITVSGVVPTGIYTIGEGWSGLSGTQTYTMTFDGKQVRTGDMITSEDDNTVLFMIPQSFENTSEASITLKYNDDQTITTSLKGIEWEEGRMITYTLHKQENAPADYIYFDLAAGNVTINGTIYSGKVYVNGTSREVKGRHTDGNRYYVYQSSELKTDSNKENTGYASETDFNKQVNCRRPQYEPVKYNGMLWSDWITNNTDVEGVISAWNNSNYTVATNVLRSATPHYITVTGNLKCHLVIDNLFSTAQHTYGKGTESGVGYRPEGNNAELTISITGDNRFGNLRYWNGGMAPANNNNKLIFEGTGSLTVADVVDLVATNESVTGHYGNHFNSAIGATDHGPKGSEGIIINGGTIFAGTTAAENSSAIGGGGNGVGVVTINGGTVTAVAHTTGTAIGGGIGFSSAGGAGYVTITGGNVYAYNLENPHGIPSAAIGGAGSRSSGGAIGQVFISGGNIYAYSVGGTAIGGGSSKTVSGGEGKVTITGGNIIAKSVAGKVAGSNTAGAGIGGGTGGSTSGANGGTATVTITGNPIIRTGSIGGGKTNNSAGHIGSAKIDISGGDIQAQFVMAAGAEQRPSFTMSGGLIRNSDTEDQEFFHVQGNGGAVYLEDGSFTMNGGEIRQCLAEKGGAIYIKGTASTAFSMTGGTITECVSNTDGGAVYLEGGKVSISGGVVSHNLANNGNGGGFCIVGGNFSMPDGGTARIFENATFSQNNTGGNGGGIYVTSTGSNVTVDLLSGSITENSSDRAGGGICVDMTGHESVSANVTVGKSGVGNTNPSISSNHTIILGGGLYAKGEKANIIINSGRITGNTISGYVSNPDVANEGGMVTLNGGDVTHVTVTYNNNGESVNSKTETAVQKIVTSTNSKMAAPTFEILGYKFTGWNTRPDGKGTTYTDGQTMNMKNNLTLYAQWRRDINN